MKKNLSIIILSVVLICLIVFLFIINKPAESNIKAITVQIDIYENGDIVVGETAILDYDDKFNERWRDIKFDKLHDLNPLFDDIDQSKYINDRAELTEAEITQVIKDGQIVTHRIYTGYSGDGDYDKFGDKIECDPYSDNCESLYVDATNIGGLGGSVEISYKYKIEGMLTQYNDVTELNYCLYEYFEGDVDQISVSVDIIADTSKHKENDFYAYGHGPINGKIIKQVIDKYNITDPDFSFEASDLKKNDFFEIRILMPNEIFTDIDSKNIVEVDMFDEIYAYEGKLLKEKNLKFNVKFIIDILTALIIPSTLIIIFIVYRKYDREYKSSFEGEYYRELPSDIPPAHMSYLYYFGKTVNEDVTATILNLIRKKVLILDDNGEGVNEDDPNYILKYDPENPNNETLQIHEIRLIDLIINDIGDTEKVSFDEIKAYGTNYKHAENFQKKMLAFKNDIKKECKNYDFFEKGLTKKKAKVSGYGIGLFIIGVITLFLTFMLELDNLYNLLIIFGLAIIYLLYVASIKKRSKKGNDEYHKWEAYKKFLEEFSTFEDYPIPSIVIWEEYLPYATSLKIADRVMKQLEVNLPSEPIEGGMNLTYMNSFYYRRKQRHFIYAMNNTWLSLRMECRQTIASHQIRSSGGGRGGFSGGSSFGGGGGGSRAR